jgi:hypothetical protein
LKVINRTTKLKINNLNTTSFTIMPLPKFKDDNVYHFYRKFAHVNSKNKTKNISCPQCFSEMDLCQYASHVKNIHEMNPERECIFCMGKYKWNFGEGTKRTRVVTHRLECIKKFLELSCKPVAKKTNKDNVCLYCYKTLECGNKQDIAGRKINPQWKYFYESFCDDSIFNLDHGDEHVMFTENSGLGSIMYDIFQKFNSKEYLFFHIMIRAIVYDKFIESVHKSKLFALPYQCLCDGFKGDQGLKDESEIHHKHMIIFVKTDYNIEFSYIWRNTIKNKEGGKSKFKKPITTHHYLMNAIYYVSSKFAKCDGSIANMDLSETTQTGGSHYFINRELYFHAKLAIACLYQNGHQDLLNDYAKSKNVEPFHEHVERFNNRWRVQIKHLNLKTKKCIIPFEKNYILERSNVYNFNKPHIYIFGVDFQLNIKLLDMNFESWYNYQLKTGNAFLDLIMCHYYILNRNQAKVMNQLVTVNKKWDKKYKEKSIECEQLNNELEQSNNELKQLKEKYITKLEEQNKQHEERVKQHKEQSQQSFEQNKQLLEQNKQIIEKVIKIQKWNNKQMQILQKEFQKERNKERIQRLKRALQVSNMLCAELIKMKSIKPS